MAAKKNTPAPALGAAERAVYDLIRANALSELHVPLYAAQVAALTASGLVRVDGKGRPHDAAPGATPAAAAPPEVMPTLTVKIPRALLEAINALTGEGENRSNVIRALLEDALAARRAKPRR